MSGSIFFAGLVLVLAVGGHFTISGL